MKKPKMQNNKDSDPQNASDTNTILTPSTTDNSTQIGVSVSNLDIKVKKIEKTNIDKNLKSKVEIKINNET